MSSFQINQQDQKSAERIRRQYLQPEDNKLNQLKNLDNKVKTPGKIAAFTLSILGGLIMGAGMSLIMVWGNMTAGLLLGIPGLVALVLAYPVYELITQKSKKALGLKLFALAQSLWRNMFSLTAIHLAV